MAHNEKRGDEFRVCHETYSKIKKSMLFAGDVWQEKTNDDTSSEIMRFFFKKWNRPTMVTNKNSSESNIFEELFRFWGVKCGSRSRGVAT